MSVSEVRNTLPELLKEIADSREPITITRYLKPIARLVPYEESLEEEQYPLRGLPIEVAEDFDDPLPDIWKSLNT